MADTALAGRYAKAVIDLDLPKPALEKVQKELTRVAELYAASTDLRIVLANPAVSLEERKGIVRQIATKLLLSPTVRNLLLLLCDKDRSTLIPEIAAAVEAHVDSLAGIKRAKVTSSGALQPTQISQLNTALSAVAGGPVRIETAVDERLIGGIVVELDGKVYDGSVRKRLEMIKDSIVRVTR
jgi:F-type H+-transporting ATPase subunit delta